MTEVEFQKTLQYFLDEDHKVSESNPYAQVTSQYRYVSPKVAQTHPQTQAQARTQAGDHHYDYDYDEDEAIRIAIMNSLEDEFPKNNQHSEEPTSCQSSVSSSSSSYSYAFHNQQKPTGPMSEVQQQDCEYRAVCEAVDQQNFDIRNQEWLEANAAQVAEEEKQKKEAEVISRYYGLPPEPNSGITIAVIINGERCIRKFNPKMCASDVYSWVAGQTINCDDEKLFLDEFELIIPGKGVLDPELTLEEQELKGRIMLQIHDLL